MYKIGKPFKKVQFIHCTNSKRVVACFYCKLYLTLSQIFQNPYVHHIYHLYIKLKKENKMKKYLILLLIFCSGCAGMTKITRNADGKIERIDAHGNIETIITTKDETIAINNKGKSPLEGVVSITGQKVTKE